MIDLEITNKAIARITEEMMKQSNDQLILMVEEHLTEICTTEAVAEKLLNEEKTLAGCSKILWAEAGRKKVGSGAFISDAECLEIAEKYYGITEEDKAGRPGSQGDNVIDIFQFL